MTEQQIKQAALSIWRMRQPAFIQRQRQVEARREIEHRRLNQAFYAAIGTAGDEDKQLELDGLTGAHRATKSSETCKSTCGFVESTRAWAGIINPG